MGRQAASCPLGKGPCLKGCSLLPWKPLPSLQPRPCPTPSIHEIRGVWDDTQPLSTVLRSSVPGSGNSSPLQYSGLENSMDRGVWQATGTGS